jgi:hypothetical protein
VSGLATSSVTAALIVAGFAGPIAGPLVYGPAARPQVASVGSGPGATAPASQTAVTPAPGATTPPATSPPPASTTTSTGVQPPANGGKAAYPAGIARHAALPAGIAKKPDPFAQWRAHH